MNLQRKNSKLIVGGAFLLCIRYVVVVDVGQMGCVLSPMVHVFRADGRVFYSVPVEKAGLKVVSQAGNSVSSSPRARESMVLDPITIKLLDLPRYLEGRTDEYMHVPIYSLCMSV